MYWLLDISGKISLQCMKVFKRKTQFCMLLTPVFPGRKRGGLKFTDEPTGALDSRSADELLGMFMQINRDGQTILMVTHSVKAASTAGRVLFIKDGEVFHQLYRGSLTNEQLYQKISDTLTVLATGGEKR